ncbi:MAG: anaerobic ribonucleoside-triphosphate reductase activating protein [Lachnospiraceae bacterium]|nr:anaerobic ribonucleoside-triphosphate reductase activating protein [Lachnospiraceae bacterium]
MNYHNIIKDDMLNGDGLRVVLFVSGCDHHCFNCHNPETWDELSGIAFDENAINEIFMELDKDYVSGLTVTGGDPLYHNNVETVTELSRKVKEKYPDKTIWLYTGFVYEDVKELEIFNYIDVVVDGPYIDEMRDTSLRWRGSSNQRVIRLS